MGLVLSPIAGGIVSLFLSGLSGRNPPSKPRTIRETERIYIEKVVIIDRSGNASNTDEAWVFIFAAVAIAIEAVWGYAVYAKQVIFYSQVIALAISGFALVTMLKAIYGGYLQGVISWVLLASPFLCITGVWYLSELAYNSYYSEYQQLAIDNGAFKFYFEVLPTEHQSWIFLQIVGLLLVFVSQLIFFAFILHYFATINFEYGTMLKNMWRTMSYSSRFFAGWGGAIFVGLSVLLSWLLLNGSIYKYFNG